MAVELQRCESCWRQTPPETKSRAIPTPLQPHILLLLALADEFDGYDRDHHWGATAFVDWLALNLAAGEEYTVPAGRPGRKKPALVPTSG